MPQKDPTFYDTYILNYNVPEMIDGAVRVSHWNLAQGAYEEARKVNFDSTVDIDALSGATRIVEQ